MSLGSSSALGATSGATTVASGAVLDLNGQSVGAEALTINGTGIASIGALINSNVGTAASFAGNIVLASNASIGGPGGLTLSGTVNGATANADSLTLVGAGTKTFTGIVGGTNSLASLTQDSASGTVEFDANATVGSGGAAFDANLILSDMTFTSAGAITIGDAATDTLTINSAVGIPTLVRATAGSIVLNSATTAHQSVTFTAGGLTGDLTVQSGITGDANVAIALNADRTATMNSVVATAGNGAITVSGNGGSGARNIVVNNTGSITTVNGAITLDADQGAGLPEISRASQSTAAPFNPPVQEHFLVRTGWKRRDDWFAHRGRCRCRRPSEFG